MEVAKSETLSIKSGEDVVRARQLVRTYALTSGFSLVDQTKVITAASEIARNMIDYANGGDMHVEAVRHANRSGVRLVFIDQGPGITDIAQAMTDGFTSGGGLGLGLSGAKRLSSEFAIETAPGAGTKITLTRWK